MQKILFFLLFSTIMSCKINVDNSVMTKAISDTTYLDKKGNAYNFLGQITDSFRKDEQEKLIHLLNMISLNYIAAKDNKMVLNVSKRELLANIIP